MRLNELSAERVAVSESSLSRLLEKSKQPFAIITAHRSSYSKDQNIKRNRELRAELNQYNLGVHQLVGHWRECQDPNVPYEKCPPGQLRDVVERSYFVPVRGNMTATDLEEIISNLANKYEQDAFIISDGDEVSVVSRNGTRFNVGRSPALGKIGQAYSQHVKKMRVSFVFEGLEVPTTNIGRMLWQKAGLTVPPSTDTYRDMLVEAVN